MKSEDLQKSWEGRTVSHYRLLKRLGSGGMGVVYKAQDLTLERLVALKFLSPSRQDDIARQRLLREARATSALDHSNICTIYEIEQDDNEGLFIAMAFCEGETLKLKLDQGPLDLEEALELASQLADGLAHAHSRGVIHRDIKPSNLILTPSNQLKIIDFGIAVLPDASRITHEGAVVGTMAYMSPEQLLGRPLDHRTDIWSFGVVLYELLTGRLPFEDTASSYAAAVLSQPLRPVKELRAALPESFDVLLARMMAKDPTSRYQQAYEVTEDIQALLKRGELKPLLASTAPSTLLFASPPWLVPVQPLDLEIHPRVENVFVGRQEELTLLASHLLPEPAATLPAVVGAVQGMPGVGKSFLADRFAVTYANIFPGGYLRLVIDPKSPAALETLLEELAARLKVPGGANLVDRVRERLWRPRTLLHIENVDSPSAEVAVGRFLQALPGSTAIVTGRLRDLGRAIGWRQIQVAAFDEETSLRQLWEEWEWRPQPSEEADYRELVRNLGYLPLAVHLAAGHLRSGRSVTGFLRMLRQRRLALKPAERAEIISGASEEARQVLAPSFSISVEILREEIGTEADRLIAGLRALGHAPLTGFGRSLGAALAGLSDEDFEELVFHAQKLGFLFPLPRVERPDGAWNIHPLVAEFLHASLPVSEIIDRMTAWFLSRLPEGKPGQEVNQGHRWREIENERAALGYWLQQIPASERPHIRDEAWVYASRNGPFHVWIDFCESALRDLTDTKERSDFFWFLSRLALRHGLNARALEAAQEHLGFVMRQEDQLAISAAHSLIGDALQARGSLDEALATWQQQQIPILEKLGDETERALVLCKVAFILKLRERFDEALYILQEEAVPAFEKAQDVRSRAIALGLIADLLEARGEPEPASRIRQSEEIPTYDMLGETRAKAVTIGKIASTLHTLGEYENALKILKEQQKPSLEKLGDTRELALCLGRIASVLHSMGRIEEAIQIRKHEQIPMVYQLGSTHDLIFAQEGLALLYLERQYPQDQEQAAELLRSALDSADRLQLPVADRIRTLLEKHGLT